VWRVHCMFEPEEPHVHFHCLQFKIANPYGQMTSTELSINAKVLIPFRHCRPPDFQQVV
jgi:hypothetical protein